MPGEKRTQGRQPEVRAWLEQHLIYDLKSMTWAHVQTMDLEGSRKALYQVERLAAMLGQRHRICLEQGHYRGKTQRQNAETAAEA